MSLNELWQTLLPHHPLSRLVLRATRIETPWFKNALIGSFMRGFSPEMSDAVRTDPFSYASFNDFFTRELAPGARPLDPAPDTLVSPVDGTWAQAGRIDQGQLVQAKGRLYDLGALLAGAAPEWQSSFTDGEFATIYLAPYNYHRIHLPSEGTLRDAWYVPGRLFSVNTKASTTIPGLFIRNERVVLIFDGPLGPFAVILVGALFVGSMTTIWHGDVAPRRPRKGCRITLPGGGPEALPRGAEIARFNMGSTVILLYGRNRIAWDPKFEPGRRVRLGERIGSPVRQLP